MLTLLLCGLAIAAIGAGEWSIDDSIDSEWLWGWKGLITAAGRGWRRCDRAARRLLAAAGEDERMTIG